MDEKPIQETTSIYFNDILKQDVKPITVDELPAEVVERFNCEVRLAFGDDGDTTVKRVRYLMPYILQAIDWQRYGMPLEGWQMQYYYRRDRFLKITKLDYQRFLDHEPLQQAIDDLGLEPEPTFEFILFLKYYYGLRQELKFSSIELLQGAREAAKELPQDKSASIDINIGGRHFKITNTSFVKATLGAIDTSQLRNGAFINDFNEGGNRDKIRAIDYYILRTLLDYLPIRTRSTRGGLYSQEERNFGLSILSLLGRLPDIEREIECGKDNNATFDKLMRDFRDTRIPFAMELFL